MIVDSIFRAFGTHVRSGAVRHPQSQGSAERMNKTLLTMIRKLLEESSDWKTNLGILLFYYRTRPHSATGLSPMEAMLGWMPRHLVVSDNADDTSLSARGADLACKSAKIRDLVEGELSKNDTLGPEPAPSNPYEVGQHVLFLRPELCQKSFAPFDLGWQVHSVFGPSTVKIRQEDSGRLREKTVNIDLVKSDNSDDRVVLDFQSNVQEPENGGEVVYNLRDRSLIQPPLRYRISV